MYCITYLYVGLNSLKDHNCLSCQSNHPEKLFSGNSNVVEIDNGSLEKIDQAVQANHLVFVMFYAPWCYSSRQAAIQFAAVADRLSTLVSCNICI